VPAPVRRDLAMIVHGAKMKLTAVASYMQEESCSPLHLEAEAGLVLSAGSVHPRVVLTRFECDPSTRSVIQDHG
jgi:hypothetical protein